MIRRIHHALIMAAGRGNRLRPLTDVIPKAMVPYGGDTLIGNSLAMLSTRVPFVHVTVGYRRAQLAEYLMTVGSVRSIFNTEGHSNSWWIYNTLMQFLDEPVLVLTCDNVTELDVAFLADEYETAGCPACMLVPVRPVPGIDGDYIEHSGGVVTSIQRDRPTDIYCSGIQVLNPAMVTHLAAQEGDFGTVWTQLMARRHLRVCSVYPQAWYSVDCLEHLAYLVPREVVDRGRAVEKEPRSTAR